MQRVLFYGCSLLQGNCTKNKVFHFGFRISPADVTKSAASCEEIWRNLLIPKKSVMKNLIFCRGAKKRILILNPLLVNVLILYPLKIPENLVFCSVFRRYKTGTLARNGLTTWKKIVREDMVLRSKSSFSCKWATFNYSNEHFSSVVRAYCRGVK